MRQRFDWAAGPAALSISIDTSSDVAALTVTGAATTVAVTLSCDQLLTLAAGRAPEDTGVAVAAEGPWLVRITVTSPDGTSATCAVDRAELAHAARHLADLPRDR